MLPESGGAYLEPTVVTGAGADNPLVRDEIFGPVLAVQVVDDEAEAVRVAGDTPYGLAAARVDRRPRPAHRSRERSGPAPCGSTATRRAT